MPRGRNSKEKRNFRDEIISAPEAAAFLKIPQRTFDRLVETGVIPKDSYGEYILGDVFDAFVENVFDSKGLKEAQTELIRTRARKEKKELDALDGELVPVSVVMKVYTENISNIRAKLLAMPTKISPELIGKDLITIQAKMKHEIYETLKELANYDSERIANEAKILRGK